MRAEQLDRVADALYRAAFQPSAWSAALDEIAAWIGAPYASVHMVPIGEAPKNETQALFGWRYDMDLVNRLLPDYAPEEPFSASMMASLAGDFSRVAHSYACVDVTAVRRGRYFNEYSRPVGFGDCLAVMLSDVKPGSIPPVVSVIGRWEGGAFDTGQCERFAALAPHIRRVGRLIYVYRPAGGLDPAVTDALDTMEAGCLLLAADGRALFVNAAFRAALGSLTGLQIKDGHLLADRPGRQRDLDALLASALAHRGDPRRGAAEAHFFLPDGSLCACIAAPLGGENPFSIEAEQARAVVYLTISGPPKPVAIDRARRLYDLTIAETQVLADLAAGLLPEHIALRRHRAVSTVRSQVRALLVKAGARRIGGLLAQVSRLGGVRG